MKIRKNDDDGLSGILEVAESVFIFIAI